MSLKIIMDRELSAYESTTEGDYTLEIVQKQGKLGLLESVLEEQYPDGIDEGCLDDILSYERDEVFRWCGIPTQDELDEEKQDIIDQFYSDVEEVKDVLTDILDNFDPDIPMEQFDAEWDQLFCVLKEKYHRAILDVRDNREKYNDY